MDTWLLDLWFAHTKLIVVIGIILLALAYRPILWLCGVILVPNDSIGVVTRKFSLGRQRELPDGPGRVLPVRGRVRHGGHHSHTGRPGVVVA